MSDSSAVTTKAERLARLCHLLYRNPRGLTVEEIARLSETPRRTVQRDLLSLDQMGVPLWDDKDDVRGNEKPRYGIIEGYYLPPVHLDLDDARALFLAARLLARYADSFDPHIAEALAKLAGILPQPMAAHVHATIRSLARRPRDERVVRVLATLGTGWATQRKVRITYQASGSQHVHEYLFCPYLLEPSAVGYATYAIGHSSHFDDLHTFKVERVLSAELTDESFTVPAEFDGPELLRDAWGVWYGDDTEQVVLRFAPTARRRVLETTWHASQQLEDCDDGGCIMRLRVASPVEMTYWIRGWGPQVEVLAPAWLRDQLRQEADSLRRMYGET